MRLFTCSSCREIVFFENVRCTACGHILGYLPDQGVLSAIEAAKDDETGNVYVALAKDAAGARYRLCRNSVEHEVCNWLVREDDPEEYCVACRLNDTIPDLSMRGAADAWARLEQAKRRLLYTLGELGLPVESRRTRPDGLSFSFLADVGPVKAFTGHSDGLIVVNIAEADDPFRERIRVDLGEGYRTVLGHFRHEIGHYYWDRLVKDSSFLTDFRALFGDETQDYDEAVKRHYAQGAPPDWPLHFVSSYATMHPWEDWAETWAHYLHIVDTLGTATSYDLALRPKPVGPAKRQKQFATRRLDFEDFDAVIAGWVPLSVALNSLNRSMGLRDAYPFVLTATAIRKLRLVHDVIEASALTEEPKASPEAVASGSDTSNAA